MFTIRLVRWLAWVFKNKERKKELQIITKPTSTYQHTNTSLHNNIPHPKYNTKRQHRLKTHETKRQHTLKTHNKIKHNIRIIIILQIITIPTPTPNIQINFKTRFMCPRSIAGVPWSQALPGFLITAPPPVCVPDVTGALAVRWQNKTKTKKRQPFNL